MKQILKITILLAVFMVVARAGYGQQPPNISLLPPKTQPPVHHAPAPKPKKEYPDVYVVGHDKQVTRLWKNGIEQDLVLRGKDSTREDFLPNSVFVAGKDVYVAGHARNQGGYHFAALCKNGVVQLLTDKPSDAKSVFVSGNDVYVAGAEVNSQGNTVATLWKNGAAYNLTSGNSNAVAQSVYVFGNDVYVVGLGYEAGDEGNTLAKLWKNGVDQNFTDRYSVFNSVFVVGNNVYVAGQKAGAEGKAVATLWKNGIAQSLTDGKNSASATSVFVVGNDVYVAGSEECGQYNSEFKYNYDVARLWKNGVAQNLSDGTNTAQVFSLFVYGSDVYMAGSKNTKRGNMLAILWKNGVAQNLSDGTNVAQAFSVFVK